MTTEETKVLRGLAALKAEAVRSEALRDMFETLEAEDVKGLMRALSAKREELKRVEAQCADMLEAGCADRKQANDILVAAKEEAKKTVERAFGDAKAVAAEVDAQRKAAQAMVADAKAAADAERASVASAAGEVEKLVGEAADLQRHKEMLLEEVAGIKRDLVSLDGELKNKNKDLAAANAAIAKLVGG